jgi:hypothetical protein
LLALFLLATFMQTGCGDANGVSTLEPPTVILEPPGQPAVRVRVELARTPDERNRGLMFRQKMAPNAGMLFLFPKSEVQVFWMKNTYLPLDMIFLEPELRGPAGSNSSVKRATVVGVVERAPPLTTEPRSVFAPSKYVLEVNGGFCRTHRIGRGTVARMAGVF